METAARPPARENRIDPDVVVVEALEVLLALELLPWVKNP
jgi:hypothetical protein